MEKEKVSFSRIDPLIAYFKKFGTIKNISQNEKFEYEGKNINIGWIITNIRRDRKNGDLSDKDVVELLDYMGMRWDGYDTFEDKLEKLKIWYNKYKTLSNLTQYSTIEHDGEMINVGDVVHDLRRSKKKNKLTKAQVLILDEMDFVWTPKALEVAYYPLIAYKNMFGSIADIKIDEIVNINGKSCRVGRQVNHARDRYKKGLLDKEEIDFFEDLGMVWSKKTQKYYVIPEVER